MRQTKAYESIVNEAKECFEDDTAYWNEMQARAEEDYKFYMADDKNHYQWNEKVRIERERDDRPVLTFNRTAAAIDQVINDQKMNRMEIRVRPSGNGAAKEIAEIYEGLIRRITRDSAGESAFDTGFEWAVPSGWGAARIINCYENDDSFEQILKFKRIPNPLNVVPDPGAKEENFSDMMHCFITEQYSHKAFEKKFPKARKLDWESTGTQDQWFTKESVRVAEYFVRSEIKKYIGLFDDGSTYPIDKNGNKKKEIEDTVRSIQEEKGIKFLRNRMVPGYEVVHYILNGVDIISEEKWPGSLIPVIIITGKEVICDGKRYYKGLVRNARDPQRVYNYMRTTNVEAVALQPKAPFMATVKQVQGYESIWKSANKKNYSTLIYNSDPNAPPPQRQTPPIASSGLTDQSMQAVDDIKATTKLFDASLGASSNETSGKAIMARERQGDVGTYNYQDNLKKAQEYAGRVLIDAIPNVYDSQRIVQILTEDGKEQDVEIFKQERDGIGNPVVSVDLSVGRYDITVDTGPSYTTKRVEAAESITAIIQAVPDAAAILGDKLVQNMDWPGADDIAARLKRLLAMTNPGIMTPEELQEAGIQPPQDDGPDPEMQKKMIDAQIAEIKLELERVKLAMEQAKLQQPYPMM